MNAKEMKMPRLGRLYKITSTGKPTGNLKKSRISNLFVGSGAFTETPSNTFQGLIVDEAHRLNEKSGLFSNLGENPIKELIDASTITVFFLDEDQRIQWKDIGNKTQIREWAKSLGATVTEMDLESQFRCNGSDGYLAWIDRVLQVRETANTTLEGANYEFKVCVIGYAFDTNAASNHSHPKQIAA